jgi:DNA-3-methyladenine glycosylase II
MRHALRHLRATDDGMQRLIAHHGAPELSRSRNHLQSLTRAIVYQQLSGKAAATIYGRFLGLYGGRFPDPAEIARTPEPTLRAVGLSNAKAAYVRDLARHFADGLLTASAFARMSDDALVESLTRVKGIGEWSVHMFLVFGLNRPDVLPTGDLGIRKGMQLFFRLRDLPKPDVMQRLAEPWRPYRSIGSWYMWRATEAMPSPGQQETR